MRRIKAAGVGFIKLDGRLINLKDFKFVGPVTMGYDEDPDGQIRFAIGFTPSVLSTENSKNNVDGTWRVSYKENEKGDFEADCKIIEKATRENRTNKFVWGIIIPIIIGLILLVIEYVCFIR
jgi:hypothetical protein